MPWKVGELARQTGLTVRTLHHWEAVGLLEPARRTEAGYRLYGEAEAERLLRIVALRQLGMSLAEVRDCLERPEGTLPEVLERQVARLDAAIAAQQRLRDRLQRVVRRARQGARLTAETLVETLEAMTMFEKHFTPEQLQQIEARRSEVGEERIREVEAEWPRLIAAVRAEMARGTDPADPRVAELARRWMALVREFTAGDPGITAGVAKVYREEPAARERTGLDPEIMAYVQRAWQAQQ